MAGNSGGGVTLFVGTEAVSESRIGVFCIFVIREKGVWEIGKLGRASTDVSERGSEKLTVQVTSDMRSSTVINHPG